MKYAELPDGKRIPFSDDVSEDKMRRAVRDELGLTQVDLVEILDKLVNFQKQAHQQQEKTLHAIKDGFTPVITVVKALDQTIKDLSANFDLQIFQSEQVKKVEELNKKTVGLIDNLQKSLISMLNVSEKLSGAVTNLSKNIDETIDHSTQAIQADLKTTTKAVTAVETVARTVESVANKFMSSVDLLQATAIARKTAHRNSDGSWTLEIASDRKH